MLLVLRLVPVPIPQHKILESKWQQEQVENTDASAMPLVPKRLRATTLLLKILVSKLLLVLVVNTGVL